MPSWVSRSFTKINYVTKNTVSVIILILNRKLRSKNFTVFLSCNKPNRNLYNLCNLHTGYFITFAHLIFNIVLQPNYTKDRKLYGSQIQRI